MSHTDCDFVGIVAGLPRSGTSMMMRMVEAGGFPVLTDNIRTADVDNPNGYYEFERVKQDKDQSWLDDADGKFVKMVYKLIYKLPSHKKYKIIFMARNLDEVLLSQGTMLRRLSPTGREMDSAADAEIKRIFRSELTAFYDYVATRPNMAMVRIDYGDVLTDPRAALAGLPEFLGRELDIEAMTAVCEPSLYRNRA